MTHETCMEFDIVVEFDYYGGCRGSRDSLGGIRGAGPPLEPDDPPEVNINKITLAGVDITETLTDDQLKTVEDEIWEQLREAAEPEPPDPTDDVPF